MRRYTAKISVPPSRRMEDKIRSLCAQILAGKDELTPIVELRDALHQHIQKLRAKLSEYPVAGQRRRATSPSGETLSPQSAVEQSEP